MPLLQGSSSDAVSVANEAPSSKLFHTSTAHLSSEELGKWQTSTRLLASLLNDYLIEGKPVPSHFNGKQMGLLLYGKHESLKSPSSPALWIGLSGPGKSIPGRMRGFSTPDIPKVVYSPDIISNAKSRTQQY